MSDQHQAIDELIERLLPLLVMVKNNPDTLHVVGGEMCSITQALDEMFRAHLQMEEEVIFPAIRKVLPETIAPKCCARCRSGGSKAGNCD